MRSSLAIRKNATAACRFVSHPPANAHPPARAAALSDEADSFGGSTPARLMSRAAVGVSSARHSMRSPEAFALNPMSKIITART